jgi:hypothetical protein
MQFYWVTLLCFVGIVYGDILITLYQTLKLLFYLNLIIPPIPNGERRGANYAVC